jgi:hypothetical protein
MTTKSRATVPAVFLVLVVTLNAYAQGPCLTASKFGPTDQIGNLNHVTPEKTLAATKLVTKGKSYRLGIETNKDTPAYPPRTFAVTIVQPGQNAGTTLGPTRTTYNDDIINGWAGVGTQLDGLGHIGVDNLYYNCNRAIDFAMTDGLKKLGVENVPPVATRGVLLDMSAYFNTDIVKEGTAFNRAEIEGAMKRQGIKATSAMPVFPIEYSGTKPWRRNIRGTTSRESVFTEDRQADRMRSAGYCFIPSSTKLPFRTPAVTTTAWTRSGGTNSG